MIGGGAVGGRRGRTGCWETDRAARFALRSLEQVAGRQIGLVASLSARRWFVQVLLADALRRAVRPDVVGNAIAGPFDAQLARAQVVSVAVVVDGAGKARVARELPPGGADALSLDPHEAVHAVARGEVPPGGVQRVVGIFEQEGGCLVVGADFAV